MKGYCPLCNCNFSIKGLKVFKYTFQKYSPRLPIALCPECLKAELKKQQRSSGKKPV
jgi:hypothetical protein